jgi:hypothetical protein
MIDFTHGMSLHDHAKKNQYFIKNTSTQVVLDKHAGALSNRTVQAAMLFWEREQGLTLDSVT